MISKKILLLSSSVLLLNACGGSNTDTTQSSDQNTVVIPTSPSVSSIDLTNIVASNVVPETKIAGASTSSRALVSTAAANTQAEITLPQENQSVQGNVTFLVQASDDDGIAEVNLVLPNINKSITLCAEQCGISFEQSVIGLSPYFYGEQTGDVRLEIWLTDNLDNQVLADAITFNWLPYQIDGITAVRDGQNINLSWQDNTELNRYNVYAATQMGVSPQNIDTLENGQQFLSLSSTVFSFNDAFPDQSYQILITGVNGSGESGFSEIFNIASVGGELNFPPQAQIDQFEVNEDQSLQGNVLINDTDMGELYLNVDALVLPQHGDLTINKEGIFTYIPTANFSGEDAFSYQVVNELGATDTATVEIVIKAQNDAPIALDNNYSIPLNGSLAIASPGILANDSDIDLDSLTVDTIPVSAPERGTLTLYPDGSFEYQGEIDMRGSDSFQYRIIDNQGAEAIAQVIITGGGINIAPVANNDNYSINEDNSLTVDASEGVLNNDTDANNDSLAVDENFIISPLNGDLLLAANGSFTYIPDANFYGADQFQYQIVDAQGATAIATVTLTITSESDNPIAQSDEYQFRKNQILEVPIDNSVLINDINIEVGDLHVNTIPVVNVQNGVLTLKDDGSFSYQPDQDFEGVDSFTYLVSNDQGLTATAQVILSKSSINTLPEAVNDLFTFDEDSAATLLDVLANDTDADGDSLTISSVTADIGTVAIIDGKIQYTAPANTNGVAVITYTVSDGYGESDPNTVTITINAINDAPIASGQSFNITESATNGDTIGNIIATDIENQNLSYALIGGDVALFNINSDSGLLTVKGSTPFNYATATQHVVTVSVTDDGTPNETTTITVTVNIAIDLFIPVETATFGRPLTGEFEFSSVFSSGGFNDSVELESNIYFVGYSNNVDKDIYIASYNNNGAVNTTFGDNGVKTLDLGKDEEATAIISNGSDLFIAYSSFDGTSTEACLLKMDVTGTLNSNAGEGNSGIRCTTMASTLVINDLELSTNKIHAVGKESSSGSDDDSLWIKYDVSTLSYESSSPQITDVSGNDRDDEAFSIKDFNEHGVMIVGSVTSENGDKDALIRYLISDGNNEGNFNGGTALSLDLSGINADDELFDLDGLTADDFTAFIGGYTTLGTGEKEAVIIAIDKLGVLVSEIGSGGIAIYDIDGNSGAGNGGAEITGVKYEPVNNQITLSGTTGKDVTDELFSARISISDGTLDVTYASSGMNIISGISGTQLANAVTIDSSDYLWISGVSNNINSEPFIAVVDNSGALFTDFSDVGYLTLNTEDTDSDDQSMKVLQLNNGTQAGKYIIASTANNGSAMKLVLTRLTDTGLIDTTFGKDGHQQTAIDLSSTEIALAEQSDGQLIIVGSHNATSDEEGFVARLNQDGSFDTSFATDGIYDTTAVSADVLKLTDTDIDSNNNIIAIGSLSLSGTESAFILRLNSSGALDTSFNGDGIIEGSSSERYETLYVDENDNVFVGGKLIDGENSELLVMKLSATGLSDSSFATSGTYSGVTSPDETDRMVKILMDSSNNLYLIGNEFDTPNEAIIVKLSSSGELESTFGTDGIAQYTLALTGDTKVHDAVLDSAGKIVLSGIANDKGMLARISTDGALDNTFGFSGVGYYEADQCSADQTFTSIILQDDTQVVISSTCHDGSSNNVSASKFNFYENGTEP